MATSRAFRFRIRGYVEAESHDQTALDGAAVDVRGFEIPIVDGIHGQADQARVQRGRERFKLEYTALFVDARFYIHSPLARQVSRHIRGDMRFEGLQRLGGHYGFRFGGGRLRLGMVMKQSKHWNFVD